MGQPGIRKVRRLSHGLAAGAVLITLLLSTKARAQDLDVSLFKPVASPNGIIGVETARVLPHWSLYAALNSHYANDELVARRGDQLILRAIHHRVVTEVAAGASFFERLDVSAALPIVLRQYADDYPLQGDSEGVTGLGDLRISARGILLRNKCDNDIGLAAVVTGVAPTGDDDRLMGEAGGAFIAKAVVDYCHPSGFILALNAGGKIRKDQEVAGSSIGDEIMLGLGAELPLGLYGVSLLGEVETRFGMGTDDRSPDRLVAKKIPTEIRGAARWRSKWGLMLTAGMGVGVTNGYGAPDYRAFLGIGYSLDMSAKEEAAEPTPEKEPKKKTTPRLPAGVPAPKPEEQMSKEAFDLAVAEDPDPDGDGIVKEADRCPADPEDRDGFQDADGCPDLDNDKDGVPDVSDKCPLKKEVVNGIKDDDGCPDVGKAKVAITATKVEILERVFFETGSDLLKVESEDLLKQVAALLKANWQVRRVRVEGHTDIRGDKEMNVDLSERRARRVKVFLEDQGVARNRLEARGYGPTKPIASNRTKAGLAKNRRVEFTILEQVKTTEGGVR